MILMYLILNYWEIEVQFLGSQFFFSKSFLTLFLVNIFFILSLRASGDASGSGVVTYANVFTKNIYDQHSLAGFFEQRDDKIPFHKEINNNEAVELLHILKKEQVYQILLYDFKQKLTTLEHQEGISAENVQLARSALGVTSVMKIGKAFTKILNGEFGSALESIFGFDDAVDNYFKVQKQQLDQALQLFNSQADIVALKQKRERLLDGIMREPLHELENEYVQKKRFMQVTYEDLWKKVEEKLLDMRNKEMYVPAARNFVHQALALPYGIKKLVGLDRRYDEQCYFQRFELDPFLESYNDELKVQLRNIVLTGLALSSGADSSTLFRTFYLHGQPATGKDTAVKHLAKVLGLPMHSVVVQTADELSKIQLLGTPSHNQESAVGWLAQALTKKVADELITPSEERDLIERRDQELEHQEFTRAATCSFTLGEAYYMRYCNKKHAGKAREAEESKEQSIQHYLSVLDCASRIGNIQLVVQGILRLGDLVGGDADKELYQEVMLHVELCSSKGMLEQHAQRLIGVLTEVGELAAVPVISVQEFVNNCRLMSHVVQEHCPEMARNITLIDEQQQLIQRIRDLKKLSGTEIEEPQLESIRTVIEQLKKTVAAADAFLMAEAGRGNSLDFIHQSHRDEMLTVRHSLEVEFQKIKDRRLVARAVDAMVKVEQIVAEGRGDDQVDPVLIKRAKRSIERGAPREEFERSCSNVFLVLSEFDRVLFNAASTAPMNFALGLFDKEKTSFDSSFFGCPLAMRNVIILLLGNNQVPDEEKYEAIKDRLTEIHFPGFSQEKKREIFTKNLENLLNSYGLHLEQEELVQFIDQAMDQAMEEDSLRKGEKIMIRLVQQKVQQGISLVSEQSQTIEDGPFRVASVPGPEGKGKNRDE